MSDDDRQVGGQKNSDRAIGGAGPLKMLALQLEKMWKTDMEVSEKLEVFLFEIHRWVDGFSLN